MLNQPVMSEKTRGWLRLRGPIPPALRRLERLAHLDLRWNDLQGRIPRELGRLPALRSLLLANNRLDGEIPPSLGDLSTLSRLDLSNNRLSGQIPPTFAELWNLRALGLRHNQLTGRVPTLPNAASLERLLLNNNELTGRIPAALGDRESLTHLNLASNKLHSHIPQEFGQLSKLEWLSLGENQLQGTMPPDLGTVASLRHLDIRAAGNTTGGHSGLSAGNPLHGLLPAQFGDLKRLAYLDISGTRLSGPLPAGLGDSAERTRIVLDDAQCGTALRGPETSRTSHTCGEVNPSDPPANVAAILPISTKPLPGGRFSERITQAMAAMAIVDGRAATDAARMPAWMDPAKHERTVERFNNHIRNAGFIIRSADDLLRAMETYDSPTTTLPADNPSGIEVPAELLDQAPGASSIDYEGAQQLVTLGKTGTAENPSGTGGASATSATYQIVAHLSCSVGVREPKRRDDHVEATSGGLCRIVPLVPDIQIPALDWTLHVFLQRHEQWLFWDLWLLTGSKSHTILNSRSPWWIRATVASAWCPNGRSRAWGVVEAVAPPPYQVWGSAHVAPVFSTVSGCMKPPGNCKFAQYHRLNAAVTRHCKTSPPLSCVMGDTCSTLRSKRRHVNECIDVRQDRENTCFAGGDVKHQMQIEQRGKQREECDRLLTAGNCIEWWPF